MVLPGVKKECTCKRRDPHTHGTTLCYSSCGCRCDDCRRAWAAYRAKLAMGGSEKTRTPVTDDLRAHLLAVCASTTRKKLAAHLRVGIGTVYRLTRPDAGLVTRQLAREIMAIPLDRPLPESPSPMVDSVGARRRIKAMQVAGYSLMRIARETGVDRSTLRAIRDGEREMIFLRTHQTIKEWAPRLCYKPVKEFGKARVPVKWRSLAAWDDDQIDDPQGQPTGFKTIRKRQW